MAHSFDMLTFDFLLKPPQPFTGLFFRLISRVIVINSSPFLGAKNKTIHLIICRLVGIIVIVTLFLFFTSTFGTFLFL